MIRNSRYSLRAFARDLGYSSARLSQFLNGDRGLSVKSAHKMVKSLGLSEYEKEYFINLVISDYSKSVKMRKDAKDKINSGRTEEKFTQYDRELDVLLSKWYLVVLTDIITLHNTPSLAQIAKMLKISLREVELGLQTLAQLNVIKLNKAGKWCRDRELFQIKSPAHAKLIRQVFKAFMLRAIEELDVQPVENRKYLASTLAIDKSKMNDARRELESFNLKFIKKYSDSKNGTAIYCMGLQFYELS